MYFLQVWFLIFFVISKVPELMSSERTYFDVCDDFGIPRQNCSCDLFKKPDGSPSELCLVEEHAKNGTVREYFNVTAVHFNSSRLTIISSSIALTAAIASIIGNSIIIAVAVAYRRSLSTFKRIIASLAVCDIVFAVLNFIREVSKFWTEKWKFGTAFCKIFEASRTMGSNIAIGIILIISVERYIGIVHPFGNGLFGWRLYILEILNVLFALCTAIPIFIFEQVDSHGYCRRIWPQVEDRRDSRIFNWFQVVVYLMFPTLVMSGLYFRMILHLRKSLSNVESSVDFKIRKQRHKDNMRIVKLLVCILTSFVILVGPCYVTILCLDYLYGNEATEGYYTGDEEGNFLFFMFLSYPFHTAVNPVIYSVVDKRWRRTITKLIDRWIIKTRNYRLNVSQSKLGIASPTRNSHISSEQFGSNILLSFKKTKDTLHVNFGAIPNSLFSGLYAIEEMCSMPSTARYNTNSNEMELTVGKDKQNKEKIVIENLNAHEGFDTAL